MPPAQAWHSEESGRSAERERRELGGVDVNAWHHPSSFYCPISQQCMHDPVVLADGHSYERHHIERWLLDHGTSPVSGVKLPHQKVIANHALRNAIEEYFQQIFQVHRRAIRRTFQAWNWTMGPGLELDTGSNAVLLRSIDALMQCSLLMHADRSVEWVLQQVADEAKAVVGAEVAAVFLVDAKQQCLVSTTSCAGKELRLPISKGFAGLVATTGESIMCNDPYSDPRFDRTLDHETGFITESLICVPVLSKGGSVMGIMRFCNRMGHGMTRVNSVRDGGLLNRTKSGGLSGDTDGDFTSQDQQFLEIFAAQAAATILGSEAPAEEDAKAFSVELPPVERQLSWPMDSLSEDGQPPMDSLSEESEASIARLAPSAASSSVSSSASPLSGRKPIVGAWDIAASVADSPIKMSKATVGDFVRKAQVAQLLAEASSSWRFDVRRLGELTEGRPLSTLGVYLFEFHGLVDHFQLDRQLLADFFAEIERGYDERTPYHNAAHAACVLHVVHCVLHFGGLAEAAAQALEDASSELVAMAVLFGAAVHDLGHLGVTNDFLVKTGHERALRYNDLHVNESHHLAMAFSALQRPELNFMQRVPSKQYNRFRALVIRLVMGTDMVDHGQILKTFKENICPASEGETSMGSMEAERTLTCVPSSEQDAILLLQVALKCSDLGHLTLSWEEHVPWVQCLEREFFAQGDKEKALGISPISFLMDRQKPGPTQTQVGFYNFVVMPLFQAFTSALPGTEPLLHGAAANLERWQALDPAKAD